MAESDKKKKPKPAGGGEKSGKGGGLPTLTVGFGRGFKLLFLWSLLPMALMTWCAVGWHDGPVLRGSPCDLHRFATWFTIGGVVGGAGLCACAQWLFWPVADWIRTLTVGGFAKGNKFLWFVPLVAATPVWLACYAAACLAAVTGAIVAWQGLERLGLLTLIKGVF
jgi:hypothetical protein